MKRPDLDAIDIRILCALQKNGPISKNKLAELVNLSPTPAWARLKRLTSAGLIRGHRSEIALDKIADFSRVVVTLALSQHRKPDFDRLESYIQTIDEITDCVATGGGMDYVLRVICRNLSAFQALMDDLLERELGIERYMTYIETRTIKAEQPNLLRLMQIDAKSSQ